MCKTVHVGDYNAMQHIHADDGIDYNELAQAHHTMYFIGGDAKRNDYDAFQLLYTAELGVRVKGQAVFEKLVLD